MNAAFRRPFSSAIPGYSRNAMLQLIIATGVCFVAYFFTAVCFQAFAHKRYEEALAIITPYIALPSPGGFLPKFWTILTYGWVQPGFFAWLSTAVWIYCWASVVQGLVGHRQIIPLFVYGLVGGGLMYLGGQLIPGVGPVSYLMGASPGLMALAAAAFTLTPNFRFYLGPTFSIPIVVVAVIFVFLMVMNVGTHPAMILSLVGGAATGYFYVRALQRGNKPGEWVYEIGGRVENSMTPRADRFRTKADGPMRRVYPAPQRRSLSQRRVDELLEKIHQKGYNALTEEEKQILVQASKESE
jgi:membrane associated rhomboid family serine protease